MFEYTDMPYSHTCIMETSPCCLGNLHKNILHNCFKNLLLFVERINIKFLNRPVPGRN